MINHVVIDLERYNELLQCEAETKKPKRHTIIIPSSFAWRGRIETDDDAVAEIAEQLKISQNKVVVLEDDIMHYQNLVSNLKEELNKSKWWEGLFPKKKTGLPDYKNPPPPPERK